MAKEFYGATVEAMNALNDLLSLPASGREQDWEFELADPKRIDDMLNAASLGLSYDEKCALALITIASIEEAIEASNSDRLMIAQAKTVLRADSDVYEAMKFYWLELGRASNDAAALLLWD